MRHVCSTWCECGQLLTVRQLQEVLCCLYLVSFHLPQGCEGKPWACGARALPWWWAAACGVRRQQWECWCAAGRAGVGAPVLGGLSGAVGRVGWMEEVLRVTAVIPAGSACCAGGYACGVYNACKEMRRISEGKLLGTREKSFPQISVFQYPILSQLCTEAHCNARPAQPLSAGRSSQPGHLLVPRAAHAQMDGAALTELAAEWGAHAHENDAPSGGLCRHATRWGLFPLPAWRCVFFRVLPEVAARDRLQSWWVRGLGPVVVLCVALGAPPGIWRGWEVRSGRAPSGITHLFSFTGSERGESHVSTAGDADRARPCARSPQRAAPYTYCSFGPRGSVPRPCGLRSSVLSPCVGQEQRCPRPETRSEAVPFRQRFSALCCAYCAVLTALNQSVWYRVLAAALFLNSGWSP